MTRRAPVSAKKQYKYSASAEEQAHIRRAVQQAGLSVSAFVVEAALGRTAGVSAESFANGLAVLETTQKELRRIAYGAPDDADGLLILSKLNQLERTIRLLASVREFVL
ncbi:hypothetical protein [Nereida sp. MMG025]|uniref:plasmid mobilization protein n=1 Tax=Nereida sp. MMG025 TaxID=2909981 RepID=UPI001F360CFC|nr:hypothetical protein [Nereida sp. MMG025]MCF6443156.1 hypothetical protein [Nereida sp. MMG025]